MSDQVNNLSGTVKLDTTEYKANINELNRQIRVLTSGFDAQAAKMGDWDKTATGLETKNKSLAEIIELQRKKVDGLTKQYDQLAAGGKASSAQLENLQVDINKATKALNESESELSKNKQALTTMGNESKETGKKVKDLGDKEKETETKTGGLKAALSGLGSIGKVAGTAILGIFGAISALGVGISGLVLKVANLSGELVDTSLKTGLSVERLQELKYIGGQVGTDVDTITGSFSRLIRSMDAVGKNKDTTATFKQLGIDVRDANGNLRNSNDVFDEVITALGKIENPTERDALAIKLLGKNAQELDPLIKASGDELERLRTQAHLTGAVMSEETVNNFEAFGDTLDGLKLSAQGNMGTILGVILPGFQSLAGGAQGYLQQLSLLFVRSEGDSGKFASGLGEMLGRIVTVIAKKLPDLAIAGANILQGIINAIVSNFPVLLPAVIQIITTLANFLVSNIVLLVPAAIQLLMGLINAILGMMPQLLVAAVQIILALAQGLIEALPQLIPAVVAIIPQLVLTLLENLPLLIQAALQLIIALATGLIAAIPVLIPEIPKIVVAIFDVLIQSLPMIANAAMQLIMMLATGIGDNLPMIGQAAGDIITALWNGITDLVVEIWNVGSALVTGIYDGLKAKEQWFNDQVKAFFKGIVDSVKKLLGIASPSKVFSGIGSNMAAGMAKGFTDQMKDVNRQVRNAVNDLSSGAFGGMNLNLGLAGIGGGSSQTLQFYAPVIVQGAAGETLADMLSQRRY